MNLSQDRKTALVAIVMLLMVDELAEIGKHSSRGEFWGLLFFSSSFGTRTRRSLSRTLSRAIESFLYLRQDMLSTDKAKEGF